MKGKQFTLKEGLGELSRINKEQADILNTIPTSIVLLDKNGIIIKVNQKLILAGRKLESLKILFIRENTFRLSLKPHSIPARKLLN